MFKNPFVKKMRSTQPETARLAHRAVKLAKLAKRYAVNLSDGGAIELAKRLAGVPDAKLDELCDGAVPMIGCPCAMPALLAGYSHGCGMCPYNVEMSNGMRGDCCALKEE